MDLSVGCTIVLDIVNALNMSSAMNMHIVVDVVAEKLILHCRDIGQATLSWDATTPHMRYLVEHQLVPVNPTVVLLLPFAWLKSAELKTVRLWIILSSGVGKMSLA